MRGLRAISKEFEAVSEILSRITKIKKYIDSSDEDSFANNEMLQDAIIRQLEVIGEASKRVGEETRTNHPSFPWKSFAGMRDRMTHQYDRVDLQVVWDTVDKELPSFEQILYDVYNDLYEELKLVTLWQNLSDEDQQILTIKGQTAISQFQGKDYLVQLKEDTLYCDLCSNIKNSLANNSLFANYSRSVTEDEAKQLSYGKIVKIDNSFLKYDLIKSSLIEQNSYQIKLK